MALSRVRLSRRTEASVSLGALPCVICCEGENSSSSLGNAVFFSIWWAVLLSRLTTAWRYVTQAEWCRNDSNSAAHVWYFICWSCFQRHDVCTNICFLTEKCTSFCAAIRFCSAFALSLCQGLWNRNRKNVRRYFHVCILGFGLKAAASCWMQTWTHAARRHLDISACEGLTQL